MGLPTMKCNVTFWWDFGIPRRFRSTFNKADMLFFNLHQIKKCRNSSYFCFCCCLLSTTPNSFTEKQPRIISLPVRLDGSAGDVVLAGLGRLVGRVLTQHRRKHNHLDQIIICLNYFLTIRTYSHYKLVTGSLYAIFSHSFINSRVYFIRISKLKESGHSNPKKIHICISKLCGVCTYLILAGWSLL